MALATQEDSVVLLYKTTLPMLGEELTTNLHKNLYMNTINMQAWFTAILFIIAEVRSH